MPPVNPARGLRPARAADVPPREETQHGAVIRKALTVGPTTRVPQKDFASLAHEALTIARTIRDEGSRAHTLLRIVGYLPDSERESAVSEALGIASRISDESRRTQFFVWFASILPKAFFLQRKREIRGSRLVTQTMLIKILEDNEIEHGKSSIAEEAPSPPDKFAGLHDTVPKIDDDQRVRALWTEILERHPRPEILAERLASIRDDERVFYPLGAIEETTGRSAKAEPRPEQPTPSRLSSRVEAVFGNIPPGFRTRAYTKRNIPDDLKYDPEVLDAAKEIVNSNRYKKVDELEPEAREKLRTARGIVRANEGRKSTLGS